MLKSFELLIKDQEEGVELSNVQRLLEKPKKGQSANVHAFQNKFQSFQLINRVLFIQKLLTLEKNNEFPSPIRKVILKEFHDKPLAGHWVVKNECPNSEFLLLP